MRLPEPGTPAFLAGADQYTAAAEHAARIVAEHTARGVTLVGPGGPWARTLLHAASHGRRAACRSLHGGGPRPRFTVATALLLCADCFAHHLTTSQAAAPWCSHCGMFNALRPVIARDRHTVAWGRLCWWCAVTEQAATRGRR